MSSTRIPVVVVDDDQWLAAHIVKTLEKDGYDVRVAGNALDAMDVIDDVMPKVVILDMFMPGPNGMVLLHELQSHADLSKIPVILCSNGIGDMPADMSHYGVRYMLDKSSMHPSDITASVKKVLA